MKKIQEIGVELWKMLMAVFCCFFKDLKKKNYVHVENWEDNQIDQELEPLILKK